MANAIPGSFPKNPGNSVATSSIFGVGNLNFADVCTGTSAGSIVMPMTSPAILSYAWLAMAGPEVAAVFQYLSSG